MWHFIIINTKTNSKVSPDSKSCNLIISLVNNLIKFHWLTFHWMTPSSHWGMSTNEILLGCMILNSCAFIKEGWFVERRDDDKRPIEEDVDGRREGEDNFDLGI